MMSATTPAGGYAQNSGGGPQSSSGAPQGELSQQQMQAMFQQLEKDCSLLISKTSEMEQEVKEHELVLKAFDKVESTRRCFRMVGGVLVERTVAEVQPAVEQNREKIQNAIKQLEQQLKAKLDQRSAFVEKYGLNKSSNKEG